MSSVQNPVAASFVDSVGTSVQELSPIDLLKKYSCYDILPTSLKIIVFDTSLLVKKAFKALIQHGMQSAPLWDSTTQKFSGMLTVTDFIHLIVYYYREKSSVDEALEELDQLQISSLKQLETKIGCLPEKSVTLHPNGSLLEAAKILITQQLHRLPLVDISGGHENIISVITQSKILKFLSANSAHFPEMESTIEELNLGTRQNLATATLETPLIDVLSLFSTRKISAMPILNENGEVIDVYEKYDALMLAREGPYYNLDMPVSEALQRRSPDFEGIHSCSLTDTLGHILQTIQKMTVHRFVLLQDGTFIGTVSLSDVLRFILSLENKDLGEL